MNRRGNRRNSRVQNIVEKKVIRCTLHQKPVFMNEKCSDFVSRHSSEGEQNCKNCKHSS